MKDSRCAVEAAEAAQTVLDTLPHGSGDPICLIQIAVSYGNIFMRTHERKAIESAIKAAEAGVELTPQAHPRRAYHLNCLARLLSMRFEDTSIPSDLDRGIDLLSSSLPHVPRGHIDRVIGLSCLGTLLGLRFEYQGASGDLESAIRWSEVAVHETPEGDPSRAACLSNLANRLFARGQRTEQVRDFDRAVAYAREALDITPVSDPALSKCVSAFGAFIAMRFTQFGSNIQYDLDQAVKYSKQAVALLPGPGNPEVASPALALATILDMRYERLGVANDLDEAIDVLKQALNALPAEYASRANLLHRLGHILYKRFTVASDFDDLRMSKVAFQEGWATKNANPSSKLGLAKDAAQIFAVESDWKETAT